MRSALRGTQRLALEIVLSDADEREFFAAAQFSDGRRLADAFDAATLAHIRAALGARVPREEDFERLKPWAVLLLLAQPRVEADSPALDRELQVDARRRGRQVIGLEDPDEQIAALDSIPLASQKALVRWALEHADEFAANHEKTIVAWLARDLAGARRSPRPRAGASSARPRAAFRGAVARTGRRSLGAAGASAVHAAARRRDVRRRGCAASLWRQGDARAPARAGLSGDAHLLTAGRTRRGGRYGAWIEARRIVRALTLLLTRMIHPMSSPVTDTAQLRIEYKRAALDEGAVDRDPFVQFARWFDEAVAASVPEPNAMTLATIGHDGRPAARIVLLKGVDARGLSFYTNYDSRKGRELARDPRAALVFFWVDLERQVRLEGVTARVSAAESDALFREPAARLAPVRLGIAAERARSRSRLAGTALRGDRSALRRCRRRRAAAAALGRLSARSRSLRILAGPRIAPARSRRVRARRRRVDDRAARAMKGARAPFPSPFGVLIGLGIANHVVLAGSRVVVSLDALSRGASAATVGVLLALFAALPALFAISAGRLADRIGVRRPMLAGSIGIAAGAALPFVVPGLPALFAAAMLVGVSFMAFQVAAQYATGEMGGRAARVRNFGLLALGYSVSSIVAPLLAGFVIDHAGFRAAFAALMVLPLIPILVLAADRLPLPGPHPAHAAHPLSGALELIAHPELRRVFAINALLSMAWELHTIFVPIYGSSIGLSASLIGLILAAFAAATFVVRLAMPLIARRLGEHRVLTAALFVGAAVYAAVPFSTSVATLMALSFCLGLGLGAGQPMVMSLLHSHAPPGRMGEAAGVRMSSSTRWPSRCRCCSARSAARSGSRRCCGRSARASPIGGWFTRRRA